MVTDSQFKALQERLTVEEGKRKALAASLAALVAVVAGLSAWQATAVSDITSLQDKVSALEVAPAPPPEPTPTPASCDKTAGDLNQLVSSLSSGQTGCLTGTSSGEVKVEKSDITLRSAPGQTAKLNGRLVLWDNANNVTVEHIAFNSKGYVTSPTVLGDNAVFDHVDVTNEQAGICFNLGSPVNGRALNTTISNSKIHNCGQLSPSTNMDHGIYISAATGTVIKNNWIYGNSDRGIQFYPDAQSTTVTGNVIYGNGEGIILSGGSGKASSNNVIKGNVIAASKIRRNVESGFEPGNPGTGNVVSGNCVKGTTGNSFYDAPDGSGIESPPIGFTPSSNVIALPTFAGPGDYRVAPGSACYATLPSQAIPGA